MSKFCPAPWISISTDVNGSIRPCCRYEQPGRQTKYKMPWMKDGKIQDLYNGSEMKALRQAFLDDEEPDECSWCWKEEAAGIKSFRERYLEREVVYNLDNPTPAILDLKLSNVCNLRCRMCGPQASSAIAKEQQKSDPYWLENKILGTENEEIFFNEWLPGVQELELTGGEPFFSPENKQLIDRIVDSGYASRIKLLITTNGMFYVPRLMEKMKEFKQVTISLSVDDLGSRLEYARGDSNWVTISENIHSIIKNYPEFYINIYRTINNFNIYYLDELDDWAMDNNVNVINGLLHEPKYLSVQYLPEWVKAEVMNRFGTKNSYKPIMDFMNVNSERHHLIQFYKETYETDEKRNQSFKETFPEWAEILLWK